MSERMHDIYNRTAIKPSFLKFNGEPLMALGGTLEYLFLQDDPCLKVVLHVKQKRLERQTRRVKNPGIFSSNFYSAKFELILDMRYTYYPGSSIRSISSKNIHEKPRLIPR